MSTRKRIFKSPFISALIGGAVVGLFGWLAIAAGWIDSQGSTTTTTIAAPLSAPVASHEDANTVNEIYKHDGPGVAFVEATWIASKPHRPLHRHRSWQQSSPA